jgi:xylulokinase
VLEGVAFSLKDTFELMRGAGLATFVETRVSGGGARSLLWRRILASALGVELASAPTTEGAAYGAALLAGVQAGVWPDVDTAARNETSAEASASGAFPRVAPDPADAAVYARLYPLYRGLYPALKPTFDALA